MDGFILTVQVCANDLCLLLVLQFLLTANELIYISIK